MAGVLEARIRSCGVDGVTWISFLHLKLRRDNIAWDTFRLQYSEPNYPYHPMDRIKEVRVLVQNLSLDTKITNWTIRD